MRARNLVLLLLLIPFIAVLYPPIYAGAKPTFAGLPYFIWYQFAWAIISAVLTIVVYLVQTSGERDSDAPAKIRARTEDEDR